MRTKFPQNEFEYNENEMFSAAKYRWWMPNTHCFDWRLSRVIKGVLSRRAAGKKILVVVFSTEIGENYVENEFMPISGR